MQKHAKVIEPDYYMVDGGELTGAKKYCVYKFWMKESDGKWMAW